MKKPIFELNGPANLWMLVDSLEKGDIDLKDFVRQARLNIKGTSLYMQAALEAVAQGQNPEPWYAARERAQIGISAGEGFHEKPTLSQDLPNRTS